MIMKWTLKDIPDLTGKTAIVTGGNSGIGYSTALELARMGACVVIATRSKVRGWSALKNILDYPKTEMQQIPFGLYPNGGQAT